MNTQDELKGMADILLKIKKRNMYKVPEGYFTSLHESLTQELNLEEEKDIIPDDYFQKLPGIVLDRLKEDTKVREISRFAGWTKYVGLAASFVILLYVGSIIINPSTSTDNTPTIEMEYLDYLSDNIGLVETNALLNLDIMEENYAIEEYFDIYDDSLLDFYLERNLDEIELAYLEDIIE